MLIINGLTSIDLSFIRECECRSSSHFVYDSISLYVLRPLWSAGLSVNAADQPPAVLPMVHWLDFHHRGLRRRMQPRLCPYGVSVTLRCDPAEPRGVLEARYPLVARYIDSQCGRWCASLCRTRRRMQPRLCPYGVSVTLRCDPAEPRGVLEARYVTCPLSITLLSPSE